MPRAPEESGLRAPRARCMERFQALSFFNVSLCLDTFLGADVPLSCAGEGVHSEQLGFCEYQKRKTLNNLTQNAAKKRESRQTCHEEMSTS